MPEIRLILIYFSLLLFLKLFLYHRQPSYCECRQVFLKYSQPITNEETVKELDSNIELVNILEDQQRYNFLIKF